MKIRKGTFLNAHIPAHPELLELLYESNIKCILIVRDPRDVVISNFNYVTYIDTTHKTHHLMKTLSSDKERLEKVIRGVPGLISPIREVLYSFYGYMNHSSCLVIRFEDLIGINGGGSLNRQRLAVSNIAEFLDLPISDANINKISNKIYRPKALTFRSGKISQWKKVFSEEHKALFKKEAGQLLISYGYEKDMNW